MVGGSFSEPHHYYFRAVLPLPLTLPTRHTLLANLLPFVSRNENSFSTRTGGEKTAVFASTLSLISQD